MYIEESVVIGMKPGEFEVNSNRDGCQFDQFHGLMVWDIHVTISGSLSITIGDFVCFTLIGRASLVQLILFQHNKPSIWKQETCVIRIYVYDS